jgi:surface antigen
MVRSVFRLAAAAAFSALFAGCAATPEKDLAYISPDPGVAQPAPEQNVPDQKLSCVPYARARSGIDIHGDAYTWWDQAEGRFDRSATPSAGAVLVLTGYSGSDRGHVAVVSRIVSARQIRVDHANWLNDGTVTLDDPVSDVSPDNDWSEVRVWNVRTSSWGTKTYPVQGFIALQPDSGAARVATTKSDEIGKLIQGDN